MPGTIQVSVLEFKYLPDSSAQPSSVFLKVSMGKKEYQTWDKGDFSFPLTTFRDNLVVSLQDSQGNVISQTGIRTLTVVEKGLWDDIFPFEGGGYVHMKVKFILSEEERDRVRTVRESALKKKQDNVPSPNISPSNVAPPVNTLHQSSSTTNNKVSVASQPISSSATKKAVQVHSPDVVEKKAIFKEMESGPSNVHEDQGALMKTPSSVRKMISAFEGSSVQDKKQVTRIRASKSQPNIVGMGVAVKDPSQTDVYRTENMSPGRLKEPIFSRNIQEAQNRVVEIIGSNKAFGFTSLEASGKMKESGGTISQLREAGSISGNNLKKAEKESTTVKWDDVDLIRRTTSEAASGSGRIDSPHIKHPSSAGDREEEIRLQKSPDNCVQKSRDDTPYLVQSWNEEQYESRNPGACIFPDTSRWLCMTTASKNVEDLLKVFPIESKHFEEKPKQASDQENAEKQEDIGHFDLEPEKDDNRTKKLRKLKHENSEENAFGGPFRQAIKIAVVVGFGILVFLTREKDSRKSNTKQQTSFTTPDYSEELASFEEQIKLGVIQD